MALKDNEKLTYKIDDFISLKRVSEKIAKQCDGTPDLFLTLDKCIDIGVSPLIWLSTDTVVSRVGELEDMRGALFLTDECVNDLLNSFGEPIKARRFWVCPKGDILRGLRLSDELNIDSWYEGDEWPCLEFSIEAVRILRADFRKMNHGDPKKTLHPYAPYAFSCSDIDELKKVSVKMPDCFNVAPSDEGGEA